MPIKKSWRFIVSAAALSLSLAIAGPAYASHDTISGPVTPAPVSPLDNASCKHPELSQALSIFGDDNTYGLAPGGMFSNAADWQLSNGARIVSTVQPDGSNGGVLELPGKGQATSPVMCITTDYPMARLWSRNTSGNELVSFNVQYWDKHSGQWTALQNNGAFAGPYYWDQGFDWTSYTDWAVAWAEYSNSKYGQWLKNSGFVTGVKAGWRLSPELSVTPNPDDPGWQQVRFTFYGNGSSKSKSQIDAFWVDPRASR